MTKMQTDAPNSQQKPQHWINKNQINKKNKLNFKYIFQKDPSKKREEKQYRHKIGKMHNTGKYAGGETWSGHAQQDF